MDLTSGIPRSPNERLLGIPMLPRTIDKARAALAGTLGEYIYGPKSSFDMALLEFLGLTPDEFLDAARSSPDDAAIVRWLESRVSDLTPERIDAFARDFTNDGDDDADRARFAERRSKLPPEVQPKVKGWTDLLDVQEGRIT
jgi:hypothetical protein